MAAVLGIPEPYATAHQASAYHRDEILQARWCGCFYCLKRFSRALVNEWIDDAQTALCPYCKIDSVLAEPESEEFLRKMCEYWFAEVVPLVERDETISVQ